MTRTPHWSKRLASSYNHQASRLNVTRAKSSETLENHGSKRDASTSVLYLCCSISVLYFVVMGRKYLIHDQSQVYFVTFTVVNWIDIFIRDEYKEIFVDSIKYCQQHKGLQVYAWCIMTSHVHLIIGSDGTSALQDIIRDLKSYTSRHIRLRLEQSANESRKEWMLWLFTQAGKYNSNNNDFQFWQQHNHPIELATPEITKQRLDYLHNNPVEAGFVISPEYWRWSSAYDYCGGKGAIDLIFID